jgi:type I restriction enzyme M protein
VSTAILVFTKTGAGGTEKVWFYDMKADGYSLDDKRTEIQQNDIPDIITRFQALASHSEQSEESSRARTEQSFFVDKADIASNNYDLSINRYKEVIYEKVHHDSPLEIMARLDELSLAIADKMEELRGMLYE